MHAVGTLSVLDEGSERCDDRMSGSMAMPCSGLIESGDFAKGHG